MHEAADPIAASLEPPTTGLTHTCSWVTEQGPPARPIQQVWEAPVFCERTSVGGRECGRSGAQNVGSSSR